MFLKSLLLSTCLTFSVVVVAGQDEFNLEKQLKSAQAGNVASMARVGELYSMGLYSKEKEEKAKYWLNKAIASGSSEGLFQMGKLYEKGFGSKSNSDKALEYYRQASNKEHVEAMYLYAIALKTGEGVKQDVAQAEKMIGRCVELGGESCKLYQQMMANFK